MSNYCENCGCKVFKLGCVNCDEINYIEEQKEMNEQKEIYVLSSQEGKGEK